MAARRTVTQPTKEEGKARARRDSAAPLSDRIDPLIGTTFNRRYRIEKMLGKGGMGSVYLATDLQIADANTTSEIRDPRVAVKILATHESSDPQRLQKRFMQEARALLEIINPHVLEVKDARVHEGMRYFVTEYLEGRALEAKIRDERAFSWEQTKEIALQICAGLKAAHDLGIIHRDLKPDNVFVTKENGTVEVKILDFGLAKITERQPGEETLTIEGMAMGTPTHMSPEQVEGKKDIDERTDIYSLGVILYRMVTGRLPIQGETPQQILIKHLTDIPMAPSFAAPEFGIPREVDEIILRMLRKDPKDRQHNIDEVIRQLRTDNSTQQKNIHESIAAFRARAELEEVRPPSQEDDDISAEVEEQLSRYISAGQETVRRPGRIIVSLLVAGGISAGMAYYLQKEGNLERFTEPFVSQITSAREAQPAESSKPPEIISYAFTLRTEIPEISIYEREGNPATGAVVKGRLLGVTDEQGTLSIKLGPGQHYFVAEKKGYTDKEFGIFMDSNRDIAIEMKKLRRRYKRR